MAKTIAQLLGDVNRIGSIESIKSGIPNVLPPAFLNVTRRVIGRTVQYNSSEGSRSFAQANGYGAPARQVQVNGIAQDTVNAIHYFDTHNHDPLVLQNLMRQDSDVVQALAVDELNRQTAWFKKRYENSRIGAATSALVNGKIWLDANGWMLFTSSGAATTIDFNVPANNRNQCNSAITATWATTSTDIIGNIGNIKRAALQTTGYPIRHAFYGKAIPGYIGANTVAKELIRGAPALSQEAWASGEIPNGFCGLQWHPIGESFGLTSSGTATEFVASDQVIFTPEPSSDWWECVEGSMLIPSNIGNVADDAAGQLSNIATKQGMFSYSTLIHDPVTIKQYAGDTFIPLLKNGSAIFIADVVP